MATTVLQKAIVEALFGKYSDQRFVVATVYDDFLRREDISMRLTFSGLRIAYGGSLDLRIWWETVVKDAMRENPNQKFIFIQDEEFDIVPDIAALISKASFSAKRLFPRYRWETIKNLSLDQLSFLYDYPGRVKISDREVNKLMADFEQPWIGKEEKIETIEQEWHDIVLNIPIGNYGDWMPKVSDLIRRILKINQYEKIYPQIASLNELFQEWLSKNYSSIICLSVPPADKAPKYVGHILPFLAKQTDERIALIVVDGMNFWQGQMLIDSLAAQHEVTVRVDTIFSWLPSTTELSRQAIFAGSYPDENYTQSVQSETRMWESFWEKKKKYKPRIESYYEYGKQIKFGDTVKRAVLVTVDLDEKMHASETFRYLYVNTKEWVESDEIINSIGNLLSQGFKIYITTDHGNIETKPWRKLLAPEKVCANYGLRYVKLSPKTSKEQFIKDNEGMVWQIDPLSRTFHPRHNLTFSNLKRGVTHGGPHFMEVLIPFITITLNYD